MSKCAMLPTKLVSGSQHCRGWEGLGWGVHIGGAICIYAPARGSLLTGAPPVLVHAVKQRIRAIKNIGKITKAMKMVAASKMRNAQVAVEQSRGIVEPFVRLFGDHPGAYTDGFMPGLCAHAPSCAVGFKAGNGMECMECNSLLLASKGTALALRPA